LKDFRFYPLRHPIIYQMRLQEPDCQHSVVHISTYTTARKSYSDWNIL